MVMRGEAVIDSKVAPAVLAAARLLAEGLSNREIATRTHLSEHTVKGYVEEILERLGAIEWAARPRQGLGRCA